MIAKEEEVCQHCGGMMPERVEFCSLCGKPRGALKEEPEEKEEKTPAKETGTPAEKEGATRLSEEAKKASTGAVGKAGYCSVCNNYVYTTEDGSCQFGHAAENISYTAEAGLHDKTASELWEMRFPENSSGKGKGSSVPREIKHWNWGAFLLSWIWGLANKTYLSLLAFVPYIGFVMPFVLGAKGSEWAWQNRKWSSVSQFKEVQRKWAIAGVVVYVVYIILLVCLFAFIWNLGLTQQ